MKLMPSNFIPTEPVTTGTDASRTSRSAFLLICAIPVLTALLFGGVDNATWLIVTLLTVVLALLWLAESWRSGGLLVNTDSLQLPLAVLLLVGLLQIVPLGTYELEGVTAMRTLSIDAFATSMFLTRLVVFIVFFAACLVFINTEARIKKLVVLSILFGALMAFFGIIQRLSDPDAIYGIRAVPQAIPFGPFVNQHHFAAFMEMTGGVTLGLLLGRRSDRNRKVLLAFALIIMVSAILLTGSRGGMIGLAGVCVFAATLSLSRRGRSAEEGASKSRAGLIAAGAGLLIVTLALVLFVGGGESLLRGVGAGEFTGDFSSGRLHFWPIAIKIFLAHPIIGSGFDTFGFAFTRYDTWNGMFRVEQAHNDYLQIAAEGGVAGLACAAAFMYLLFRKGLTMVASAHGFRRDAAVGALAGCFGILVHSFFDFPLRTPSNAFFFLILCSISVVSVSARRKARH
jgi:O-antigen ligase